MNDECSFTFLYYSIVNKYYSNTCRPDKNTKSSPMSTNTSYTHFLFHILFIASTHTLPNQKDKQISFTTDNPFLMTNDKKEAFTLENLCHTCTEPSPQNQRNSNTTSIWNNNPNQIVYKSKAEYFHKWCCVNNKTLIKPA